MLHICYVHMFLTHSILETRKPCISINFHYLVTDLLHFLLTINEYIKTCPFGVLRSAGQQQAAGGCGGNMLHAADSEASHGQHTPPLEGTHSTVTPHTPVPQHTCHELSLALLHSIKCYLLFLISGKDVCITPTYRGVCCVCLL